ncbi:ribonuclease III [Tropicimonas sp. IMCC34011]|uniref:ribonuclease III n=1 Tax=Tropicimonas sp. IMCC34011 TaxID=2248759 RepID=UPI000E23BA6D|nr:ribonuclease III [Tropicimonas sp. IMCC34011]
MKLSTELKAFERRLGHEFAQPELLVLAVTHPSMTTDQRPSNQRLEFLGDRVLNLSIADMLYRTFAEAGEGILAPRYNVLVRKETCADVARSLDLGDAMRLGRGERITGGKRRDSALGDSMEAVLGAIYLDAGFDAARAVVERLWAPRLSTVEADARDPKTALQEWAQARRLPLPNYTLIDQEGPDHARTFTIAAELANGARAEAKGGSKRQAERAAAEALLNNLETTDER